MKPLIPIVLGLVMLATSGATIQKRDPQPTIPVQASHATGAVDVAPRHVVLPPDLNQRPTAAHPGTSSPAKAHEPKPGKDSTATPVTENPGGKTGSNTGGTAPPGDEQQPSVSRVVYLTFDDGPDPASTPQIMDILDNYGIKGTFFVVGTRVERYPQVLKEITARGHMIGNHTYNHKYAEIYANTDAFIASVKQNDDVIFKTAGVHPKIVRDPGGYFLGNKKMQELMLKQGFQLTEWNVDSYDSRRPIPSTEQIVTNVTTQMMKKHLWPDAVILFHDAGSHKSTIEALPQIIERLKKEGFEFRILDEPVISG